MPSSDRIEKQIELKAPRARVWRALTDAGEFGSWFGVELADRFEPGARVRGKITMKGQDFPFEVTVERMEPEQLFSFRWHPFAVEPDFDYSKEPMTLVEFTLEEVPGGTQLTLTESGFDRLPPARRAKAFPANEGGWAKQMQLIEKYVAP